MKKSPTLLIHILDNKRIVLGCIILSTMAVSIFILKSAGHAESTSEAVLSDEFVIKAQENDIQLIDFQIDGITKTDSIIYEKSMGERPACSEATQIAIFNDSAFGKIQVPILMYHYIENPESSTLPWLYHPPAVFEAQLKTLSNNCYHSVFVSAIGKSLAGGESLPSKPIAITFDDGYADMYTEAFPLLKKYKMMGTMYIIVNALDKPGYLTRDQVREMSDSGYVEIAAHTLNHANLKQSSWDSARYEISGSKIELEKIIKKPVTDFAYPYGFFTKRDEAICEKAGFASCASTYPGTVQTFGDRFSLYRLRPGYRVGPALLNWLESAGPKK